MSSSKGYLAALTAVEFLRARHENDSISMDVGEIFWWFLQRHPYPRLCYLLRATGLKFNNEQLARHLTNIVPEFDLQEQGTEAAQSPSPPTHGPPQSHQEQPEATPVSESRASTTSKDHYVIDELDELPFDYTRIIGSKAKQVLKMVTIPEHQLNRSLETGLDVLDFLCDVVNKDLSAESNFRYDANGFTVLIPQVNERLKYKRVSLKSLQKDLIHEIKWLKNKQRPRLVQPRRKKDDHEICWWMAQALHYGIPVKLHSEDIKADMQKTIVDGTMRVPESLQKLRRKLRARYDGRTWNSDAASGNGLPVKEDSDIEKERRKKRKAKSRAKKKNGSKKGRHTRTRDSDNAAEGDDRHGQSRRDHSCRNKNPRTKSNAFEPAGTEANSDIDELGLRELDEQDLSANDYGDAWEDEGLIESPEDQPDTYDFPVSNVGENDEADDGAEKVQSDKNRGDKELDETNYAVASDQAYRGKRFSKPQERNGRPESKIDSNLSSSDSLLTGIEKTIYQAFDVEDEDEPDAQVHGDLTAATSLANQPSSGKSTLCRKLLMWAERVPRINHNNDVVPTVDASRKKAIRRFVPDDSTSPPHFQPISPFHVSRHEKAPQPVPAVTREPTPATKISFRIPSSNPARTPPGFAAQAHPDLRRKTLELLSHLPRMLINDRELHYYLEQYHYHVDAALNAFVEDNDMLVVGTESAHEELEGTGNEYGEDLEAASALSTRHSRVRKNRIDSEDRDIKAAIALSLRVDDESRYPVDDLNDYVKQTQAQANDRPTALSAARVGNDNLGTPATQQAASSALAEGRRLYVGNLPCSGTDADLKQVFSDYYVESIYHPVNPRTNCSTGYAFVNLTLAVEADVAVAELSGEILLEQKISVQLVRQQPTSKSPAASMSALPRVTSRHDPRSQKSNKTAQEQQEIQLTQLQGATSGPPEIFTPPTCPAVTAVRSAAALTMGAIASAASSNGVQTAKLGEAASKPGVEGSIPGQTSENDLGQKGATADSMDKATASHKSKRAVDMLADSLETADGSKPKDNSVAQKVAHRIGKDIPSTNVKNGIHKRKLGDILSSRSASKDFQNEGVSSKKARITFYESDGAVPIRSAPGSGELQVTRPAITRLTPIPRSGRDRRQWMKLQQRIRASPETKTGIYTPFPAADARPDRRLGMYDGYLVGELSREKDDAHVKPHPRIKEVVKPKPLTETLYSVNGVSTAKETANSCTNAFKPASAPLGATTTDGEALRLYLQFESRRLNSKPKIPWPPKFPPVIPPQ